MWAARQKAGTDAARRRQHRSLLSNHLLLYFEPPRAPVFTQRYGDLQHPILHPCFGFFAVGAVRKRNGTIEVAVSPFGTAPAALFVNFIAIFAALAFRMTKLVQRHIWRSCCDHGALGN